MIDKKPDSSGTMDGARSVTLINAMINRMIDDDGGHARRVIDTLLDLGFTAEELTGIFLFPKGDVEQAELDAKPKLRLLLFEECRRSCPGCCNRDWDFKALPACRDYTPYRLIMLTGGEPMLHPEVVRSAVAAIRAQTDAPIYLYTAMVEGLDDLLPILDGVTVTLHEAADVAPFEQFVRTAKNLAGKSLRLTVFEAVGDGAWPAGWQLKDRIQWIPNGPLPDGEVLMRYED